MTTGRNIADDQARTAALLDSVPYDLTQPNWLGHKGGAALIDAMLLLGATKAELVAGERGAVDEHIRHLRIEHGLELVEVDGKKRFRDPRQQ